MDCFAAASCHVHTCLLVRSSGLWMERCGSFSANIQRCCERSPCARAAKLQPPYILVGEGLAGFHVRVYAGLFPGDVAGAVLVDSNELGPVANEEASKGPLGRLSPKIKALACAALLPAVVRFGVQRLFSNGRSQPPLTTTSLSPDQEAELIFLSNTPVA